MKLTLNISPVMHLPDKAPPQIELSTPTLAEQSGLFSFFDEQGLTLLFSRVKSPGKSTLKIAIESLLNKTFKVLYSPYGTPGFWFNSAFTYSEGVTELALVAPPGLAPESTHQISGVCLQDGNPIAGDVHIISAFDRAHLATVTANPSTGEWVAQVATAGEVYAFVAAPYGRTFSPGLEVLAGEIIHPTAANGYTYEVTQAGILGDTEPTTWAIDEAIPTGTATLDPKPYPAPVIQGPLIPIQI